MNEVEDIGEQKDSEILLGGGEQQTLLQHWLLVEDISTLSKASTVRCCA